MDVTQLPFNRLLGLEAESPQSDFLVSLPGDPQYTNHLGTVHAGALLAVAEAGSGEFLVRRLKTGFEVVPVVRRLEAKFRKPASGRVSARCGATDDDVARWNAELASRGRVLASLPMEVFDGQGEVVLTAEVEWFIARRRGENQDGQSP
jgi:acyl-coenzyme A thioesterase PaaI-like protein